jgi:DNA-binding beta-propeller fold protein YncE
VSPDGKNVYATSAAGSSLAIFRRNRVTGALTQLPGPSGCIAAAIAGCASGLAMRNPESLAVSGDRKNVCVAAPLSDAVDVFTRDPATGALTQATDGTGCLTSKPQSGCATARALRGVDSVTISADDRNVYLTGLSVAILTRAPDTGDLTQRAGRPGCVQPVRVPGARWAARCSTSRDSRSRPTAPTST